jgi:hypothetical protein
MAFASLRPYIIQVENEIAKTVLGVITYSQLDDAITNDSLTSEQSELLTFVQPMIAYFMAYYAMPTGNIIFSDMGVQQMSSKEGTSNPAELWRYNDARTSLFRSGDLYREFSYNYLQANQATFTDWSASDSYSFATSLLIQNSAELHRYIGKGQNIGTFQSLRPFMALAQEKYLQPLLCEVFLKELLDKRNTGIAYNSYELRVVDYAKTALAWFGLYEAMPSLKAIIIDGSMVTSMPAESSRIYQPLSTEDKNEIMADAEKKGETYLSLLETYLDAHASNLPTYNTSPCFLAKTAGSLKRPGYIEGNHSFGIIT